MVHAALLLLGLLAAPVAAAPLCASADGVYCFARGTLRPAWQALRGQVTDRVVLVEGDVLVGANRGVYRFAPDGALRWHALAPARAFSPVPAPPRLVFGTLDGQLVSVDADSGAVIWRVASPGWVYSPAVFADRVVSGGQDGVVRALARDDGNLLWSRQLDQELVHRPVALDSQRLAVTTFAGTVAVLAAASGSVVWQHRFEVPARSPVAGAARLYAALFDRRVVALDRNDGALQWQRQLPATGALALVGELLLAHDEERVTALCADSGALLWQRGYGYPVAGLEPLGGNGLAVFVRARSQLRALAVSLRDGNPQLQAIRASRGGSVVLQRPDAQWQTPPPPPGRASRVTRPGGRPILRLSEAGACRRQ